MSVVDAGYSQTPQLKKLGIGTATRWYVDGAPEGWTFEIAPDASGAVAEGAAADVVLAFVTSADQVNPALDRHETVIFPNGALWVAWPRRAGGHSSDITDNVVRDAALRRSLVDVKIAAIDVDWSGMKLVWRKAARG